MKYIEIRKSFKEYCSPLEPTKAFAYICVDLICTIYESGVLALWGWDDIGEPKNQSTINNILKTGSRIVSHFALAGPHSKI